MRAIAQTYRPEFQNRLDKVIVFRPLTRDLMRGILKKELAALLERRGLKDRAWAIEWESSALEFLLEKGFSPEMGARPLKRAIDQYVVAPLAAIIVEKRFPEGEQFLFVRSDGERHSGRIRRSGRRCCAGGRYAAGRAAPSRRRFPRSLRRSSRPKGTRAEFHVLEAEYEAIERTLRLAGMGGAQREADRRNGVGRFLEPPGPLRHAGALCPDGPGQGGDRNGQCAARPGRQILPIAAALFGRAERPLRAAIAPDQGGHQGRPRRCAGRARAGGRAGVRRRRRSPGDARVVPPADVDVSRLGREAPHARCRGAGREPRTRRS